MPVPSGTPATDIMLRVSSENGGTVKRYTDQVVKNGVYHHGSGRAEARFRNIHYWVQ